MDLLDGFIPSRQADGSMSDYRGGVVGNISSAVHHRDRNFTLLRRPFFDKFDRPSVIVNTGRWTTEKGQRKPVYEQRTINWLQNRGVQLPPVANATSLRKEEWIELDAVVLRAARYRLRAWADLAAANSFGGFNGMAKMMLEHETMTDPGFALVDMDGLSEGQDDAPKFQLEGLPLPITHSDFWCSSRYLSVSRNSGTPFDSNMGEAAGRRVAEAVEKTTIGVQTGITYGGNSTQVGGYGRTSSVYGYLNFTSRLTGTGYSPTGNGRAGTGWKASDTLADILAFRDTLYHHKFFGPWVIYTSNDWDAYLDNDYILTGGNVATQTLRERLRAIEGVQEVRRLDFLFNSLTDQSSGGPGLENVTTAYPFTMVMVQMTQDVARAVNGMDITTIQWESVGGLRLNFKVMTIQVPQLRADNYGNCGILQASFTL